MGTKMTLNRPLSATDSGYSLTFSELSAVVTVPGNGTVYLPFDTGTHRYEIKTVYAKPNKSVKVKVGLNDRDAGGFMYYESNEQSIVYDIANVPAADKTGNKKIHAFISNAGSESAAVSVIIKFIPMSGGN